MCTNNKIMPAREKGPRKEFQADASLVQRLSPASSVSNHAGQHRAVGRWLSQWLINYPSETCPATLEFHVSTIVHMDQALFCEEMVSAASGVYP